jgi:hypothetical protein
MTLSSHFIFPSSTNIAKDALVKALLLEAIPNKVLASTFLCIYGFHPYPWQELLFVFFIIATAIPGTLNAVKVLFTKASTCGSVICPKERVVVITVIRANNLFSYFVFFFFF